MCGSVNPLRHLASLAIEYDQVPDEVRSCLKLLHICNQDLQRLIEVRNEHLAILEKHPAALERVNNIIEGAHQRLANAFKLVEKCRPEAHEGKLSFRNRWKWVFVDSTEFRNQEPVISRHHAAVLAELSFVRQMALFTDVGNRPKPEKGDSIGKGPLVFENIALLGDLIADPSATAQPTPTPQNTMPAATPPHLVNLTPSQVYTASWSSASGPPTPRQELPESTANPNPQGLRPSLNCSTCTLPTLNFDDEKEVVISRQDDGKEVVKGSRQDEDKEVVQNIQQYDGKEVVQESAQEKLEGRRIVLNSTDNTGLYLLLGDGRR
ncbi:hypothetical protein B0J13DRAFT_533390 [Dactylonectria estremocensis]|uniref:Uncharacterized protein n=1 Tax=Dactylonectria estremocensis TaxID=1079267 RepID=A0A9P9IBM8_9HYPO|nr:hypothetical protein B0J13DRAFT_533390 [Dactylonectria estremocensis]